MGSCQRFRRWELALAVRSGCSGQARDELLSQQALLACGPQQWVMALQIFAEMMEVRDFMETRVSGSVQVVFMY